MRTSWNPVALAFVALTLGACNLFALQSAGPAPAPSIEQAQPVGGQALVAAASRLNDDIAGAYRELEQAVGDGRMAPALIDELEQARLDADASRKKAGAATRTANSAEAEARSALARGTGELERLRAILAKLPPRKGG